MKKAGIALVVLVPLLFFGVRFKCYYGGKVCFNVITYTQCRIARGALSTHPACPNKCCEHGMENLGVPGLYAQDLDWVPFGKLDGVK